MEDFAIEMILKLLILSRRGRGRVVTTLVISVPKWKGNGVTLNRIKVRLLLSTCPHLFQAHRNLSDEVNRNMVQSEIEGGVFLNDLPPATVLEIQTQHHCYLVVLLSDNNALISGHPQYCPEPTLVAIAGSTWGGSMLKRRFSVEVCTWSFVIPSTRHQLSHQLFRKSESRKWSRSKINVLP